MADLSRRQLIHWGCGGLAAVPMAFARTGMAGATETQEYAMSSAGIDVREHGVKADGVTDDYAALQRVFDEVLPESGGIVQLPPGIIQCSGQIHSRTKPVVVLGSGRGSTRIRFTGESEDSVGFVFDQQQYPNTFEMRNLTLITNQQESGDAITVRYTPEDCMTMRVVERVFLENVTIVGEDIALHGFRNGVVLWHANSPLLYNVCVSGRQPAAGIENRTHTESCIKLYAGALGESMPVQAGLVKCSGYNARFGVNLIGAHEGLVVTAGNFVKCAVGISQISGPDEGLFPEAEPLPDGGIRPGIWISDTHCNVFIAGIYLQDMVQGFIHNCLIYKTPDAVQDCAGVRLSHCADIKIHASTFVSHTRHGRFDGIRTENNTYRCQISNNTFEWTDASVHLGPGTNGCHVWDYTTQGGSPGALIDEGSDNRFRALGADAWHDAPPSTT